MDKPWMGYLSAGLFLAAGIFQMIGSKFVIGSVFIVLGLASFVINVALNRHKYKGKK